MLRWDFNAGNEVETANTKQWNWKDIARLWDVQKKIKTTKKADSL